MTYSEDSIKEIYEKYGEINQIYEKLFFQLDSIRQKLTNETAREYTIKGVCRRLNTLRRCINNIFTVFPPQKVEILATDDLVDVNINLHAFFINTAGVFDNLAWVFVYENDLLGNPKEGKINKHGVGLFNKKTQDHLNQKLKDYLTSDNIKSWYDNYSKNYRDTLAHRIPLYVPPAWLDEPQAKMYEKIDTQLQGLNLSRIEEIRKYDELQKIQKSLGQACHFFAHSSNERGRPVRFHAQVIADFLTIEEIINKFCENF